MSSSDEPGGGASQDWDEWEDDEGEEEEQPARSLFSDVLLPTPEAAIEHDAVTHGFDLREYRAQVCVFFDCRARARARFCAATRLASGLLNRLPPPHHTTPSCRSTSTT